MFRNLALRRPFAVFDLETTGTDPQEARIVEMSILRVPTSGPGVQRTYRVNPGIPIPAGATAVHGITDADVQHQPMFADLAPDLVEHLDGCDLCGFNLKRYDLRVLYAEFRRAQVNFSLDGRAIIDPMEIFHSFEKRDLAAAVNFYLSREHTGAHSAAADVLAAAEVLDAMLARYSVLPRGVVELHEHFSDPNAVDSNGFFTRVEGEIRFAMGKHRGQPLDGVARHNRDYLLWMLKQDFFEDTKSVVRNALNRSSIVART